MTITPARAHQASLEDFSFASRSTAVNTLAHVSPSCFRTLTQFPPGTSPQFLRRNHEIELPFAQSISLSPSISRGV